MIRASIEFGGGWVWGLGFRVSKRGFTQITDITVLGLRHLKRNMDPNRCSMIRLWPGVGLNPTCYPSPPKNSPEPPRNGSRNKCQWILEGLAKLHT